MPSPRHIANRARLVALGVAWLLLSGAAVAQSTSAGTGPAPQPYEYRLTEFWAGPATYRLRGQSSSLSLSIPLAGAAEVRSATLQLQATSSIALLRNRSLLGVRFNNATIAQIDLDPARPAVFYPVDIPAELWRSGFNTLEVFAVHHATDMCEAPDAPELWSELDLFRSRLSVDLDRQAPQVISDLSAVFSPGIGSVRSTTIFTALAPDGAPQAYPQALPAVAQALALRRRYRPLVIRHEDLPAVARFRAAPLDGDGAALESERADLRDAAYYLDTAGEPVHVLVGTREELGDVLTSATLDAINGPYLGIENTRALAVSLDGVPFESVTPAQRLIVSGLTAADIRQAARALGRMLEPLQRSDQLRISGLTVAENAPTTTVSTALQPGSEYRFAALGAPSRSYRGSGQFLSNIPVVLPADFYVNESSEASLFLDFGYAPSAGPGSTLNVLVNGEIIGGIALDNPQGGSFYRYELTIPARILRGGRNDLSLEVNLRAPLSAEACDRTSSDHLLFNLRDSSTLVLPSAGALARQPDLSLFGRTGFPLTGLEPGQQVDIALGDRALIGAGLTVAGRLAQAAGSLIEELQLRSTSPAPDTPTALVLAALRELPEAQRHPLETALGATQRTSYQLQNLVYSRVTSIASEDDQSPLVVGGALSLEPALGELAIMHATRSEAAGKPGTRILITADNNQTLTDRVEDLIQPDLWGQLDGDVFAWADADNPELVMRVEPGFALGEDRSSWLALRLWLSNHPWYWLGAFAVLITLITLLAQRMLSRRNADLTDNG